MKSKKVEEMTVEEKAQKFLEMHPDYPKEFESPEAEHLYLLKMKEELELKNAVLDRLVKVLDNHHLQVTHINEMNISSKQKIKLLKINAVNTLREHIKIEWVYEIAEQECSIIESKQEVILLILLLDTIDKYSAIN